MKDSQLFWGYAAGLSASFFWGVHSVIIRHLTEEGVNPYLIAGIRLYIGTLTIFLILVIQKLVKKLRNKKSATSSEEVQEFEGISGKFPFHRYFFIAALSLGINFLCFQKSLEFTLASDSNLIQNFSPVAVLIISSIFMAHRVKEIAPNHRFWSSLFKIVLVGSIGASLVLINDINNTFIPNNVKFMGDLIAFAGMLFFSVFVIFSSEFSRLYPKVSSLRTTMLTLAFAAIPVTFFVPFGDFQKIDPTSWTELILIGFFSTGIAYWLWNIASKRLNVIPLTLNLVYIGIITVLSEILFLNLHIDWKFILGGILMIIASISAESLNSAAKNFLKTGHEKLDKNK